MASPYGRRFTPADLERIRELASWGHSGDSIAKALGRDPLSIRKKCCALGIRLRKPSPDHRRIRLSTDAWGALEVEATRLGCSASRLARLCIEAVCRDGLFAAVIDAPVPRRRKMTPAAPEIPALPSPPFLNGIFAPRLVATLGQR
jgi:hypothetical protein